MHYNHNNLTMQIEKKNISFKQYLESKEQSSIQKPIDDSLQLLLSLTSSCLLNQMRYYDNDDLRREQILGALELVQEKDPEFILELVLYLRRELGIRTTSNFILAYVSTSPLLAKYLPKYFNQSTVLPSDLIEICQFVQIIHLLKQGKPMQVIKDQNSGDKFEIRRNIYLPNQLKKVLIEKINGFSEYQLGKYCSESKRKAVLQIYLASRKGTLRRKILKRREAAQKLKKQKNDINQVKVQKQVKRMKRGRIMKKKHQPKILNPLEIKQKAIEKTFITMKDLVSLLHMKPTLLTSAIVGSKYPKTKEQYEKSYGAGFEEIKAGKRMKLKIPETWETELSKKGNSKEIWQGLIAKNSIPYLAGIRNLRNILKANVSEQLITKFAKFICDPNHVHKNHTTPLQYYSAISELDQINKKSQDIPERRRGRMEIEQVKEVKKQKIQEQPKVDEKYIDLFKNSLKKALEISMDNVQEVKGVTSIFVDVSGSMKSPLSGGKKYGSIRQCFELAIVLGLMIKKKCQKCNLYIFSSPNGGQCYIKVDQLISGELQSDIKLLTDLSDTLGGSTDFPVKVVKQYLDKNQKVDNFIILSDMMISSSASDGYGFVDEIANYRNKVNKDLKVFSVDLRGYSQTQALRNDFKEQNFIRIYGANSSILKFITIKEGSQIAYIKSYAKKMIES